MIILDTHIWIWNVQGDNRLPLDMSELIRNSESDGIGICAISLWEVAKATARVLDRPLLTVDFEILAYPHVKLLP